MNIVMHNHDCFKMNTWRLCKTYTISSQTKVCSYTGIYIINIYLYNLNDPISLLHVSMQWEALISSHWYFSLRHYSNLNIKNWMWEHSVGVGRRAGVTSWPSRPKPYLTEWRGYHLTSRAQTTSRHRPASRDWISRKSWHLSCMK